MRLADLVPDWWWGSLCLGSGSEIFFGDENGNSSSLGAARYLCGECPVVRDCLTHALDTPEEYGIWAGTSARSRESMRNYLNQGVPTSEIVEIVIDSGFKWRSSERRRADIARGRQVEGGSCLPRVSDAYGG